MGNGKWEMANLPLPAVHPYLFSTARKGHLFGAQSPKRPRPLFASEREFCSRLAGLWWSGRSAHAGKRATERAFHQGYQGRSPCLVGTVGGRITGLGPAADCREVATSGGSGEEEDAPELHVPASKVCSFAL